MVVVIDGLRFRLGGTGGSSRLDCITTVPPSKWVVVVTVGGSEYVIIVSLAGASTDGLGLGIRSGNGPEGMVPYLNSFESSDGEAGLLSRSCPPEPVEPTRVTELKLDGDEGPLRVLSVKVSRLLDVAIEVPGIER